MKKIIIACLLIILISIFNFQKDKIVYLYQEYQFKKNYHEVQENDYTLDESFLYVEEYKEAKLEKKQDIINSIYYLLNSGSQTLTRYCDIDYKECAEDIQQIASDREFLSDLNNFVHPYNAFEAITFEFDKDITLTITNTTLYNDAMIYVLDQKIEEISTELNLLDPQKSSKEKLLAIHDYIILHTKYDLLKASNMNDNTYHSDTAYGVLIEGYGICSGYSDAFSLFLNYLHIPNYKISNQTHVWNLVKLDNQWYHMDLTWDDPVLSNGKDSIKHDYFLIDSSTLLSLDNNHFFDTTKYIEAQSES